jgi:hypothetical protein
MFRFGRWLRQHDASMRYQSPVGPSCAQNETMKVMGEMTTINKEQNNHTSPPFAECKNAGVTLCTCSRFDDAWHCHTDAATFCGMSGGGDTCVADDRARRAHQRQVDHNENPMPATS